MVEMVVVNVSVEFELSNKPVFSDIELAVFFFLFFLSLSMIIRNLARAVIPPLLLLLLLLLLTVTSSYGNQNQQFNNSCGDIHNITFPFQLQGDPSHAAYHDDFILSCDENNRTVLNLSLGKYYVQSINYTNSSIRLVDIGIQTNDICSSFPLSSLTPLDFFHGAGPYSFLPGTVISVVFLRCGNPIHSPAYINRTGYCVTGDESGSGYYSYVVAGDVTLWDFPDSCLLDQVAWGSSSRLISDQGLLILSWLDLNRELAYGFEASYTWYSSQNCKICKESYYKNYHSEDSSYNCGDCKFEPPFLSE
ncbi:uncharacterized protein LOC131328808 [Rhododendron vialii]|uniref:uncharacterized protein LOC131328808 n=1 Tax=Rhododendron vialii TaxID=182163 RepID=UPI00265E0980|nr:uncharacterized protein LOC131328808 [Rhododendron vialii]